jgi:predicted DCC family thiol-disulfide oxidoreductase YuxK
MPSTSKLKIYYDGLCHLCSREIEHYRKIEGRENLEFIDIMESTFDAKKEGLNPQQVHQVMHVKNAQGEIFTKVDAFIQIWKVLPRYQTAAKLAESKILRPFLNLGYRIFAFIRPYLPKKKKACETSPYCDL